MVNGGEFMDAVVLDGRALIEAAESNWSRPVPDCPEWDAAGLVRHTGGILAWMAAIVDTGDRVSFRALPPAPPLDSELAEWFVDNLDHTVTALREADPEAHVWTFSSLGDQRVSWWRRRLAVEMAIHRWDAQYAVAAEGGSASTAAEGGAAPIRADVASAGIDEFVTEFLPGLLAQPIADRPSGTLRLQATDVVSDRCLDLDEAGAEASGGGDADTTVRGTASDLLLWLTNRTTAAIDALDGWAQFKR